MAKTDIKQLRTIGHKLKPVVTVADKGITDGVMSEIKRALTDHELVKISVRCADRTAKREMIDTVVTRTGSELIQTIGHVALLYKAAAKPDPRLSNILRAAASKD